MVLQRYKLFLLLFIPISLIWIFSIIYLHHYVPYQEIMETDTIYLSKTNQTLNITETKNITKEETKIQDQKNDNTTLKEVDLSENFLKTNIFQSNVHVFYYIWYGNPEFDKSFFHWNHKVLPHWTDQENKKYSMIGKPYDASKDSIGANFYPKRGLYSSSSYSIVTEHFKEINNHGMGVIVISWWGINEKDENGKNGDYLIPMLLDVAKKTNVKIVFHLEPYKQRSALSTKNDIEYIIQKYGNHPSFYRYKGKPMFYIYDSYLINNWDTILSPNAKDTIRGTSIDSYMISLYLGDQYKNFIIQSNFDGIYTYFASIGFTQGSTPSNWKQLSQWCHDNKMIFIPSVGPGYIDTRIRPWNGQNTKSRENGEYYKRMFRDAIHSAPEIISITSYNEWHEGTQIEPSIPKKINDYKYEDFTPNEPEFYLKLTKDLVGEFNSFLNKNN